MGQAACREGPCSSSPGGADAFCETCEDEPLHDEHTEANSNAMPCPDSSCESETSQLSLARTISQLSLAQTIAIEAVEGPELVQARLFDDHPDDHLVSQRPCIQPNEDVDGSKRRLRVDIDDYAGKSRECPNEDVDGSKRRLRVDIDDYAGKSRECVDIDDYFDRFVTPLVDDVDLANIDRIIAQGIGMDTCGREWSRDSVYADESTAPGSFYGSMQDRVLSLPSSETGFTEEFTGLQARAVAKPAFDTDVAEEVTGLAEMVGANNEGVDASLSCECDAHLCVKEKIQIEHAKLEKDSAKTSSVATLSFQPESEPESQLVSQLEMQTKHAEMVSETDPAASKFVELPGFDEANIMGLGNEDLVPSSRQVTIDGLSGETDYDEDKNEIDFAIGDIVMLVSHGVPREHLYHAAIIAKLDGSHCTVIVLDDSRRFGIGECWPSFADMELETDGLRLGTRVVVSGMQNARTRHLNTLTGVISMHPRQWHPTFIRKPSCLDHAQLTVCVVFDDWVAAKDRSALIEPRFLAAFDDTILQLTQKT